MHNDWPLEVNAQKFFGYPPELVHIPTMYPMRMFDTHWIPIDHIACNAKVANSLTRIFQSILSHYKTLAEIQKAGMDIYDGCYNDRPIRGRHSGHSMHAYGAAIDIDADHNPLGSSRGLMPHAVVDIFKEEGWRWGGDYTGRKDMMHFEACR